MIKRSVPKREPPLSVEGEPGPNQISTPEDRRRIAARKAKRGAARGKPSKPGPLTTDISSLFKDKY